MAGKSLRAVWKTLIILGVLSCGIGSTRTAHALAVSQLPGHSGNIPAFSCAQPVRIMPLGDSITRGSSSGTPVYSQYYVSYRRDLYKSLAEQGYHIDFVGSRRTDGAYYSDFDRDHEGWGGKRDDYLAQNVYTWLTNNPADIVLLHIGTNDMSLTIPDISASDVEKILNEIDRFDPEIWVLAARIIQRVPYDPETEIYNDNVDALLDSRIDAGDKIIKVDMENGAGIVYTLYPDGDMNNDRHPYATGYAKMAATWETALKTLLPDCGCSQFNLFGGRNSPQRLNECQRAAFLPLVDNGALP